MGAYPHLVVYRDRTVIVSNPTDFPDVVDTSSHVREIQEPVVKANIIVPEGLSPHIRMNSLNQTIHRIPWRDDGPLLRAQSGGC
jgi:translation elongation factor EF-4